MLLARILPVAAALALRAARALSPADDLSAASYTLPRSVALAYHGHHTRNTTGRSGCSDFFFIADNQRRTLFTPLFEAGVQVRTFFHTYSNPHCPLADAALVRVLRPSAHEFSAALLPKIVDSYMRALRLVLRHTRADDEHTAVMLVRFDVGYLVPITRLPIEWSTFNAPYRDWSGDWAKWRTVSDLLFVFPLRLSPRVLTALRQSGERYRTGSAHYVVRYLTEGGGATADDDRPRADLSRGTYIEGSGLRVRLIASSSFHSSSLGLMRIERFRKGEIRSLKHESAASVAEIFLGIERRCGPGVWCERAVLNSVPPMPLVSSRSA